MNAKTQSRPKKGVIVPLPILIYVPLPNLDVFFSWLKASKFNAVYLIVLTLTATYETKISACSSFGLPKCFHVF